MTTYKTAAEATRAVTDAWSALDPWGPARGQARNRFSDGGRAIDALTEGTGTVWAVVEVWGDADDRLSWLADAFPDLTEALDDLLAATWFNSSGFTT